VILILGLTGWTGIFRLVRAEYLKHKVREYVLAADAVGASDARRMFVHILPNVGHVVLVQLSLHVVLFIKSEVILSFLGFGVGVETVSWGSMLAEAPSELILGMWWQIAARPSRWRSRSPPSACSPTRCATRSTRGCNERAQRARPRRRLQGAPGGARRELRVPEQGTRCAGRRVRQRQVGDRAVDPRLLPPMRGERQVGSTARTCCSFAARARALRGARSRWSSRSR
jgi:hypothetical protein